MQANSIAQAVLFSCLLVAAAVWDIRKRMVPDSLCILIFLSGLLNFSPANLWGALFALPFFLVALIDQKSMGGGDIKFLAASCSVLGVNAAIWGFAIAIPLPAGICAFKLLQNVCRRQKKPWRVRFDAPMIPILTVGLLPAYFLKIGGFIS
ncbi:A24 family peptidase [Pygmaiobacter massiliensis]|uniref:A24 family peptidase n=1 Tax=Pygmaiobacter massiliensis TaxID=1917873 RepID=UPI0028A1AD97|nr:A24 family peptidase [Pygmaiobacter massiliensis]